jgi:cytochrome oxidase Cu insertion factor (SCO1/SenC/PrrC family)
MLRYIRWGAYGLIAILVVALGASLLIHERPDGPGSGAVSVGGPFSLVDQTGRDVTDADYRGKWMLVYFGYTFCPDVCPTELQTISSAMDLLGPEAQRVVPIFITVDPERDTPDLMANYVRLFDDRLVGLTGTPAQIAAVAKAYRVYYARVTPKGSQDYLMDHSSFIYLMGPDGRFRGVFHQGMAAKDLADGIRAKMNASD